jgi:preprotein translocase subunit SecG
MYIVVIIFHVLACIALILIVLLQKGKGADLGAAFGGASQTVFGSKGAGGFLSRLTTAAAAMFMVTSLVLAYMSSSHGYNKTLMDKFGREKPAATAETVQGKAVPQERAPAPSPGGETGPAKETPSSPSSPGEQK